MLLNTALFRYYKLEMFEMSNLKNGGDGGFLSV